MSYNDVVYWLFLVMAGLTIHLLMGWFGQSDWQAVNKVKRRERTQTTHVTTNYEVEDTIITPLPTHWWDRHPAAYVHAGAHTLPLAFVFPVWAALIIGITHLLIDTRVPLAWWGRTFGQTEPTGLQVWAAKDADHPATLTPGFVDIGALVAIMRDQVAHFAVIVLVASLCV